MRAVHSPQNLHLAALATALGLGTCWVGDFTDASARNFGASALRGNLFRLHPKVDIERASVVAYVKSVLHLMLENAV